MRLKLYKCIFLTVIFIFSIMLYSLQNPGLSKKYEKWIYEEVIYIITPNEREVFFKLQNDRERDLFIEEFWRQRDPTPGTPRNEFKDEHYRRIEYANEKFGRGTPIKGWQTDRGKFYIMLGRPSHVEGYSAGDTHPIEIWYYQGKPKLGQEPIFRLLFFQRYGGGTFELYSPVADGPKSLVPSTLRELPFPLRRRTDRPFEDRTDLSSSEFEELLKKLRPHLQEEDVDAYMILRYTIGPDLAEATLSNFPGRGGPEQIIPSSLLIRNVETYPHKSVDDDYVYEFLEHKAVVEVSYSVYYMGNHSKVCILQDPSGFFFVNYIIVPETLSLDFYQDKYFTNLRTSIHMTDVEGKTIFQWGRDVPLELRKDELKMLEGSSFHLCDSFPLIPGNYTLNLLLENMVTKEFTSFEEKISVPQGEYMRMSPIIFSRKVNKDSPYSQLKRAFQMANLQIYPSVRNTFLQKDTCFLFFQIYGLDQKLKEEGLLEYTFYSRGQTFQVKRRNIDEYESNRDFLEEISLEKFPPGMYTVEVSLFDQDGRKLLSQGDTLSVTTKSFLGSWIVAQTNPPTDDPYYSYILGNQFFNKGEMIKAQDELAKAYTRKPDSLDYALSYTRILMNLKEFQRVREILMPFDKEGQESFGLFYTLGRASKEVGELKEAISFFQRALSKKGDVVAVLNSIGDCYFELGDKEQALQAYEKSLEINPDQEQIKRIIQQLKGKM